MTMNDHEVRATATPIGDPAQAVTDVMRSLRVQAGERFEIRAIDGVVYGAASSRPGHEPLFDDEGRITHGTTSNA